MSTRHETFSDAPSDPSHPHTIPTQYSLESAVDLMPVPGVIDPALTYEIESIGEDAIRIYESVRMKHEEFPPEAS